MRVSTPSNLVLIGMPGSGKSTIGAMLAEKTARSFLDTDLLIQQSLNRTLQAVIDSDGHTALREIEETLLLDLHVQNHVIATGGSAVYGGRAMTHLKADGLAIFLNVNLDQLASRIQDYSLRGVSKKPEQTLAELFDERFGLYSKYADITIHCTAGMTREDVCARIIEAIEKSI